MAKQALKERRTVNLCANAQSAKGKKKRMGNTKLWGFGIKDLAVLFGVRPASVRQMLYRKVIDPTSLESICRQWASYRGLLLNEKKIRPGKGLMPGGPKLLGQPKLVMMIDDKSFEGS